MRDAKASSKALDPEPGRSAGYVLLNADNGLKPEDFRFSKFSRFGLAESGGKQGNLVNRALPVFKIKAP